MNASSFRIFISYRRTDARGYAGGLGHSLATVFGRSSVFRDTDALKPGVKFEEAIEHAVRNCHVFLCLIGSKWLEDGDDSNNRLQNPDDTLRMEIRMALSQGKMIIPILLEQTPLPEALQLPEDIADLPTFQAFRLQDESFGRDAREIQERLAQLREQVLYPILSGQEILKRMRGGSRGPTAMGRQGGLGGKALETDLRTGGWKSQKYEVSFEVPPTYRNKNWFSPREFVSRIEQAD
jgi:hypothetical protein